MAKSRPQAGAASSRRKFLQAAGIGAAATVAAPSIVRAQGPITMRWQSTWPAKDIFHEFALDYAAKVNDMTGGDLQIEVLPAGAVVPAFGLLDAVSEGTLDGGHGVLVYHYGKQTALALWGSGPAFAMDANMLLAWHKYGGGKELLAKLYDSIGANVVSFMYGPMPTQPLGWFQEPVASVDDIEGLKFRTVGISIDVFTAMGAAVNALPGGEIVAAMDRGLLDAAEFNNASSDRVLGFPDVSKICMLQSYHQNAEQFEILFNKTKYDALPDQIKAIIANATEAASQDMQLEGDRPLFGGLQRDADRGRGGVLQDPGRNPPAAARDLRRGRESESRGKPAVPGNPQLADRLRPARHAVGAGHGGEPPHGVRSLLRRERRGGFALKPRRSGEAPCGSEPDGAAPGWYRPRVDRPQRMTAPALSPCRGRHQHLGRQSRRVADHRADGPGLRRGLQALHPEHADGLDLRRQQHALRHAFMLAGAYALAQNAHVRGDFLYSSMRPRVQASFDLVLYIVFFLPGIAALIYSGYDYAAQSWRIDEHSSVTADGPPIYPFKTIIPLAGVLVMLQGLAEIVRSIVCLRTGAWPSRLKDVSEIDVVEEQLAYSEHLDEATRKAAIARAASIDEAARQRGLGT